MGLLENHNIIIFSMQSSLGEPRITGTPQKSIQYPPPYETGPGWGQVSGSRVRKQEGCAARPGEPTTG